MDEAKNSRDFLKLHLVVESSVAEISYRIGFRIQQDFNPSPSDWWASALTTALVKKHLEVKDTDLIGSRSFESQVLNLSRLGLSSSSFNQFGSWRLKVAVVLYPTTTAVCYRENEHCWTWTRLYFSPELRGTLNDHAQLLFLPMVKVIFWKFVLL